MTQQTLTHIEHLIYKSSFMKEFHEDELQKSLAPFFDTPALLSERLYNEVRRLLYLVSGIDKSSNFGYYFYEKMQENPYPFCEDILQSAIFTESYYNLHDKSLKAYVRSYLINHMISPADILTFDKMIPEGHGRHFFDALGMIEKNRIELHNEVSPAFFKNLFFVLNNDRFPMSQKKLSCIVASLGLEPLAPAMIGKAFFLLEEAGSDAETLMVLLHLIKSSNIIRREELPSGIQKHITMLINSRQSQDMLEYFSCTAGDFTDFLKEQKDLVCASC